ncbi:uncharacterized protein L203_105072 [Cryptococcus depauperatus CBS 7841]|uniref:Uncharacterized protein n=1 Tax=Cryptococcus depauperatus CBS 7841 TaxID=1295531 RepID=A0AAJ8JWM4_9TREE
MPKEGSTKPRGPGRPKGSRNKEKQPTATGSSSLSRLEDPKTRKPNPKDWDRNRSVVTGCSNRDQTETDPNYGAYPNNYDPALLGMLGHGFTQDTYPPNSSAFMDPNQPPLEYYQYDPSQQESADLTQYDPEFSFNDVQWDPNYLPEQYR